MEKYKDPDLSVGERTEDLLSRMSFEQKIDQITCLVTISPDIPDFHNCIPDGIGNVGAFTTSDTVDKVAEYVQVLQNYLLNETPLGIPALIHCEASAGAQFTEANVFPSAIAQASTFDTDLIGRMADTIRNQMRLIGFRQALSPVVDIDRDPRWGRMTETYGEDPTLSSAMASTFVSHLQTDDLKNGLIATAKHYVGHGVTEGGLNMARSVVSERELREVHCKPFQCAITEAGLESVMESYCSLNGEPVVGSHRLLTDILRDQMGFKGFVVSDYIALDRMLDPFCVTDNYLEAGIRAIRAGLDVEYPRPKGFTYELSRAIEDGRLDMEVIDRAVRRVISAKFRLGLFEDPYPHVKELKKSLHLIENDIMNERIAEESIILLKNQNHLLPLSKQIKRIAVIGPHANDLRSYFGTFSYPACLDMTDARENDGQVFDEPGLIVYEIKQDYVGQTRDMSPAVEKRISKEFPRSRTLCQALQEYIPESQIKYARGINAAGSDTGGMNEAIRIAADADVILLTLGGKNGWGITSTVGEGVDSTSIGLPGQQERFARAVYNLHKPTVVLHFDGRPLSDEFVASHFESIMEIWQPGEMGGQAICRILFGDYNPSGRLPVTAARNVGQVPLYYGLPRGSGYRGAGHAGMIRNVNGYINDTCYPLYPFGFGLSYTTFQYYSIQTDKDEYKPDDVMEIKIKIKNTGDRDGDEVVQLYFSDEVASMVRPEIELAGFYRTHLKSGEEKTVSFKMQVSQTAFLNEDMEWIVEKGRIRLMAGSSSADIRCSREISIISDKIIDERSRGFYASCNEEIC